MAPTGIKEPFRPLTFGTGTKGSLVPGPIFAGTNVKDQKTISVVVVRGLLLCSLLETSVIKHIFSVVVHH